MRIDRIGAAVSICLTFALNGCAGYTPRISERERPTADDVYLYGRFEMDGHWAMPGAMGFGFTCLSSETGEAATYRIRFSIREPLQVIKIEPGKCTLTEFLFTNAEDIVESQKPAPDGLMKDVVFERGKAYYLGDYKGLILLSSQYMGPRTEAVTKEWKLDSVKDDYPGTTRELKATFRKFAKFPTENRMIGRAGP